jgi:hypothetical protein
MAEDWPPTAADMAEAARPVMLRELLDDEFDISPPWKEIQFYKTPQLTGLFGQVT